MTPGLAPVDYYRIADVRRGERNISSLMANIFVCLFAVTLCLVNAVIWAFVSEMPFVGICWVGGAGFCLFLQKWAKG